MKRKQEEKEPRSKQTVSSFTDSDASWPDDRQRLTGAATPSLKDYQFTFYPSASLCPGVYAQELLVSVWLIFEASLTKAIIA